MLHYNPKDTHARSNIRAALATLLEELRIHDQRRQECEMEINAPRRPHRAQSIDEILSMKLPHREGRGSGEEGETPSASWEVFARAEGIRSLRLKEIRALRDRFAEGTHPGAETLERTAELLKAQIVRCAVCSFTNTPPGDQHRSAYAMWMYVHGLTAIGCDGAALTSIYPFDDLDAASE